MFMCSSACQIFMLTISVLEFQDHCEEEMEPLPLLLLLLLLV